MKSNTLFTFCWKLHRSALAVGVAAVVGAAFSVQAADLIVQAYPIGQPGNQIGSYMVSPVPADGKVTVSANQVLASANYTFAYWALETNCVLRTGSTNNTTAYLLCSTNNDSLLTAYYVDMRPRLTIQINPLGAGYTVPAVGVYTQSLNDSVSVLANATGNYSFVSWANAAVTSTNPVSVTMTADKTLIANFVRAWTISQHYYNGPFVPGPFKITSPDGTNITVTVPDPRTDFGSYRFRSDGYANGINIIPDTLRGPHQTSCNIYPLTTNVSLTWQWVRQYPVIVVNPTNGTAVITESTTPGDGDPADFWVDSNSVITITMTAINSLLIEPDYCLVGGVKLYPDANGDITPPPVLGALSVRPYFKQIAAPLLPAWFTTLWKLQNGAPGNGPTDDPDGDGLSNSQEAMLSSTNRGWYYNPLNADTDGDGMDDGYERGSVDAVETNMPANIIVNNEPAATDRGDRSVDKGPDGNPDNDYFWNTYDGYQNKSRPLTNMEEYKGPDRNGPKYKTVNFGEAGYPLPENPIGKRDPVSILVTNFLDTADTGDQSKGNTPNTDKDTLDDGFEYSWDQWQQDNGGTNEIFLIGVTNMLGITITNVVPMWDGVANVTRVFNPKTLYVNDGGPDRDVLYDYQTAKVSQHYFGAVREYNVWKPDALSAGIEDAPHSIIMTGPPDGDPDPQRCSHPFFWDVDRDGLPDGYEVIFGYDPWTPRTPGHVLMDGEDNPDDDWMAKVYTNGFWLHNHEVYTLTNNTTVGYDARTAWAEFYPTRNQMPGPGSARAPNTQRFGNADELRGADGIMTIIPAGPVGDDASHPFRADTDGDGIWDGWESYVRLDPNLASDAAADTDGDLLVNFSEFESFVTSSTNRAELAPVATWMNKLFPTDPRDKDTDGDRVADGGGQGEMTFFNGTSPTATNVVIDDITGNVATQVFVVATWNTKCYTGGGLNPTSTDTDADTLPDPYEVCYPGVQGLDGTLGDQYNDPDNDKLPNYLEYYSASVYLWQWDAWMGHTGAVYNSGDFYGGSRGGIPKYWDWTRGDYRGGIYNPLVGKLSRWGYSGACPNLVDSDDDGMDDYYEIYHGLNPAFGRLDLIYSRAFNVPVPITMFGPLVADPRSAPWVNGSPFMDSDGDGLPNTEEAINWFNPEVAPQYHTDPTPYWITDMQYGGSWVNAYYTPGSYWAWCQLRPPFPPIYAYDFEANEGFDTDNDAYSDREELVVSQTDPLSPERPVKRRALYLPDGLDAYSRTFPGYAFLGDQLRSFTVEAWVRPSHPASGQEQVVVERPMLVPNGNPIGLGAGVRVNFRVGLDPDGLPFVGYTGEGMEPVFYMAKGGANSRLSTTNWTHLCGTYTVASPTDPDVRGVLTLYVNGQMAAQTNPDELPSIARFGNGSIVLMVGAPIMVGASDARPYGDMDVTTITIPSPAPFNFFKGWIDEVRVWDGARSQGQVINGMMRRMKQDDVFVSFYTDVNLMYLFSFDALPDPDHSPTAPAGLGFDITGNYIYPANWPYACFWGTEPSRSMVYAGLDGGDPRYVPWIENAVAHIPLVPPVDVGDPNATVDVMDGTNVVGKAVRFRNTTNPYGNRHVTYPDLAPELQFGFILYDDLLPLAWAEADEDIPMWDGGGTPVLDPFDTDGDGMPDSWEEAHGMNPLDSGGNNGPDTDIDGDGLSNFYEYLCGTDPKKVISGTGGIPDRDTDADGDRLSNIQELQHGTMPNAKDTDDDGLTDWEEVNGQVDTTWVRPVTSPEPVVPTDPLNSLSPVVPRSLYLNGVNARLIVPPSDKLMSRDWTVEAWVQPEVGAGTDGGVVVSRYVQGLTASEHAINYELGLEKAGAAAGTLRPYVRYLVTSGGVPVETKVNGLGAREHTLGVNAATVPLGKWTHIAGVFNSASNILSLYVDGQLVSYRTDGANLPPLVYGYVSGHRDDEVTIGASRSVGPVTNAFEGWLDNVRIWTAARTTAQIADRYNAPEGIPTQRTVGMLQLKNSTIRMVDGLSADVVALPETAPTRVLVRFSSETIAKNTTALKQAGLTVLNYVASDVRTVMATRQQLAALGDSVRWVGLIQPGDKVSRRLAADGSHAARQVLVQFFGDVAEAEAVQSVKAAGGTVFRDAFLGGKYVVATVSDAQLAVLAADNRVAWCLPAAESLTTKPVLLMDDHFNGDLEWAPFSTPSVGWDGPGLGSATVMYHFINLTPDLSESLARGTVIDQFAKWAAAGALTFKETSSTGQNYSIDIGWFRGAHGDGGDFDGPYGVLAHGFFPNDINGEPIAGDLHFDEDEQWSVGTSLRTIDLQQVALHEIGHCLGLGHSDDPAAVMYPFYDDARPADLTQDDIAGIQAIYGLPSVTGELTEFRFDDGGLKAEDFAVQKDWLTKWASAATLDGALFATETIPELDKDSDADGLPDWWEMAFGLDPYDAIGLNSANGDPDGDGLSNAAEMHAGTDPLSADTALGGFLDFYAWDTTHTNALYRYRIFGELYTDHDGMEDYWEQTNGLNPRDFDSNLDDDEDGWSNLAEFQVGTNPQVNTNYPVPEVTFELKYSGINDSGNLIIHAYSAESMDGRPDATFTMADVPFLTVNGEQLWPSGFPAYDGTLAFGNIVPGSLSIVASAQDRFIDTGAGKLVGVFPESSGTIDYATGGWTLTYPTPAPVGNVLTASYRYRATAQSYPMQLTFATVRAGHLKEGNAWFFAFIDRNNSLSWDEGEPAGIAQYQPVDVRRGTVSVKIGLTDALPGYQRFSWTGQPGTESYSVEIANLSLGGETVLRRSIRAPRTYLHEQDYRAAGVNGLPFAPSFAAYIYATDGTLVATNFFDVTYYPDSVATPECVYPVGAGLTYAQNEFVWKMDTNATAFNLVIKAGSTNSAALLNITNLPSFREANGTTRFRLPIYAGDGAFTNGVYYWQVRSINPRANSSFSPWRSFTVALADNPQGPWSIMGDVVYSGKVTNRSFLVQAYLSPGFGGVPLAQYTLVNNTVKTEWPLNRMPYVLRGLPAGVYYLRSFLDQNGNAKKDEWESSGFMAADTIYAPGNVTLPVSTTDRDVFVTVTDVDNDKLADDWEYQYYGNLTSAGPGPLRGYTVSATSTNINVYECYAQSELNMSPIDPNIIGRDGLPLRLKEAFGLDIWSPYTFAISTMRTDGQGSPVVSWPAFSGNGATAYGAGGAASLALAGMTVRYQLQYSDDLVTWQDVPSRGVVTYDAVSRMFRFTDIPTEAGKARCYRYKVMWE